MAESKGCEKALRSVMRGGPVSTVSGGGTPSNMRDCVATLRNDSTRCGGTRKKEQKKKDRRRAGPVGLLVASAITSCRRQREGWRFSFGNARRGRPCLRVSACR